MLSKEISINVDLYIIYIMKYNTEMSRIENDNGFDSDRLMDVSY